MKARIAIIRLGWLRQGGLLVLVSLSCACWEGALFAQTASASFVGEDSVTRGDWKARYGLEGFEIIGDARNYPEYAELRAADLGSYSVVVSNHVGEVTSVPARLGLDDRFQLQVSKVDLSSGQGKLVLRAWGAPAGEVVILSSSVDLVNWVPWLTNVMSGGAWEALVPPIAEDPRRFFRASRRQ